MKICYKCKKEKELSEYHLDRRKKDGLSINCKECRRGISIEYIKDNKERIYKGNRDFYEKNKEHIMKKHAEYRENNKDKIKKYYLDNKEVISENKREYYLNNKEKIREDRNNNKERRNRNRRNRRLNDPLYVLTERIRNSIICSISNIGCKKNKKSEDILGCSFLEFRSYIESKFESWMTWENYGKYNGELNFGWDIDHIIPTSSVLTEEDAYRINHYTNLQPLCSYTNRYIKRDEI